MFSRQGENVYYLMRRHSTQINFFFLHFMGIINQFCTSSFKLKVFMSNNDRTLKWIQSHSDNFRIDLSISGWHTSICVMSFVSFLFVCKSNIGLEFRYHFTRKNRHTHMCHMKFNTCSHVIDELNKWEWNDEHQGTSIHKKWVCNWTWTW